MKHTYRALLVHLIVIIIGYQLMFFLSLITSIPDGVNLLNWDSKWYNSIREDGYTFLPYEPCNLAFFPLFPYFWRFTGLSAIQISIFNYIIFLGSFYFLVRKLKVDMSHLLVILSIPSFLFFGLVYSEALFFLFGTLIIIGYKKKNLWLICVGLLGASLIRSVSVVFIPALLITEFLVNDDTVKSKKLINLALQILSSLTGVFISAYIQFASTGKWFYFIEIQQFWRRHWILPQFPLTTVSPERIIGIEAVAFTLGVFALIFLTNFFWKRITAETVLHESIDKSILFSALFLVGTTIIDTTFTYNNEGATNIWSLNRHLLCTPFAVVFLIYIANNIEFNKRICVILVLLISSCLFLTGVFRFGDMAFYYLSFFFFLFLSKISHTHKNWAYAFYIINVFYQLVLYGDFLDYKWVA